MKERLKQIQSRIDKACKQCGRDFRDVNLLWVSKTKPIEMVLQAKKLGAIHFGENKVQEIVEKFDPAIPGTVVHMIGPLQSNKAKKVVLNAHWVHSISSIKLLQRLQTLCEQEGKTLKVLFQVNTSGEESKSGLPMEEAEDFLNALPEFPNLLYCGLMTIGINHDDPEKSREGFRYLKSLQSHFYQKNNLFNHFKELSMGMSNDLEVAIEEGSTMIRVGTALFGSRL